MIAGLPHFQEGKELYSLHLNMAEELMKMFNQCRLADIATVEQVCGPGFREASVQADTHSPLP